MGENIIERCARAVAKAYGLDPDAISPRAKENGGHEIPEWMFFAPAVSAVLAALREPSDAMIEAACGWSYVNAEVMKTLWQRSIDHLIDTALTEGTEHDQG